MPRSPRTRIAPGVYADSRGLAVVATAAGTSREKRYPLGTALKVLKQWQDDTRGELRKAATERARLVPAGSFTADVVRYLELLPKAQRKEAAYLLSHWLPALGQRPRASLTLADLRAAEATWDTASVSAKRHRRRALKALYAALDGPDARCPVAHLPALASPHPAVRAIPFALAETVLGYVSDRGAPTKNTPGQCWGPSKARIRLRLILYTGLPHATLRRLTPESVHLEAATVTLPPRRKGKGAPAATLPLLPQAVDAFRDWLAAKAWGPFVTNALGQAFRRAVRLARAAGHEVPHDLRVYDLRHTFLSYLLETSGDLHGVAELAQHSTLQMTKRYTQRAATARARHVIETVARRSGTEPR